MYNQGRSHFKQTGKYGITEHFDKYISKFRQKHFAVRTNTFCFAVSEYGQDGWVQGTQTTEHLDKYIWKFRQIHFAIWKRPFWQIRTNIFRNFAVCKYGTCLASIIHVQPSNCTGGSWYKAGNL